MSHQLYLLTIYLADYMPTRDTKYTTHL